MRTIREAFSMGAVFGMAMVLAMAMREPPQAVDQFIGQIAAVSLLRKTQPELSRPYRIWLYPVPNILALLGWIFVFATTDWTIIAFGLGTLVIGILCFFLWSRKTKQWPFSAGERVSDAV